MKNLFLSVMIVFLILGSKELIAQPNPYVFYTVSNCGTVFKYDFQNWTQKITVYKKGFCFDGVTPFFENFLINDIDSNKAYVLNKESGERKYFSNYSVLSFDQKTETIFFVNTQDDNLRLFYGIYKDNKVVNLQEAKTDGSFTGISFMSDLIYPHVLIGNLAREIFVLNLKDGNFKKVIHNCDGIIFRSATNQVVCGDKSRYFLISFNGKLEEIKSLANVAISEAYYLPNDTMVYSVLKYTPFIGENFFYYLYDFKTKKSVLKKINW